MAGSTLTTYADVLKTLYLPPVREQIDNSTVLLKFLEKKIEPVEGKNFSIPLHVSRNQSAGVGAAEGATLRTAGNQGYATAIVPVKYLYSSIQISGQTVAASKSNKGSFLRVIDSEMKGVTKDTSRSFNRQLHSDGRDALGFWVSGATTSLVFDDGLGNAGYDFIQTGVTNVDGIDSDNTTVNYGIGSTGATAVTLTRSTLGATGRTGTLSSTAAVNVAVAAGDFIVAQGSYGNAMTGIQAVITNADPVLPTGGLHGLTVAAQPDWVAQFLSADGATTEPTTAANRRDLTFEGMQQILSAIATNSDYSEKDVKLILCSYQMKDTYAKLCKDERRWTNVMDLDGGFKGLSYNGIPVVPDVHCRHNRMYFISPESLALYRMADLDWMDPNGNGEVLYRISGGDVDAVGARLFSYQNLGCSARNANGVYCGISEIS